MNLKEKKESCKMQLIASDPGQARKMHLANMKLKLDRAKMERILSSLRVMGEAN